MDLHSISWPDLILIAILCGILGALFIGVLMAWAEHINRDRTKDTEDADKQF